MHIIHGVLFYIFLTIFYCSIDKQLQNRYHGNYYLLHGISNIFITYSCLPDLKNTYTDLNNFHNYPVNYVPSIITFSLHSYHIINYFNKLMFDDWLHHILMCGVALPIGLSINSGFLLNHSLFFLIGLPGGINYILLFLSRNKCIEKLTQKRINTSLNLWIRAPGCISQSALTFVVYNSHYELIVGYQKYLILCAIFLTFWNGIYFMEQVVSNYAVQKYKSEENLKLKNLNSS